MLSVRCAIRFWRPDRSAVLDEAGGAIVRLTLAGQTHEVSPDALAPVLREFFGAAERG